VEKSFPREAGGARALWRAMRPQQWAKNFLVFLPMLAGQAWLDLEAWRQSLFAFWALSLSASAIYLFNDAADIDSDRRHPRKRQRPFASGALSPALGLAAAALLLTGGAALGALSGALPLLAAYVAIAVLYTIWLKRAVLVDVFVIAALHIIRVILGGVASGYLASDWLLAFCGFFFLNLALVKRAAEVDGLRARGGGEVGGRGYLSSDGTMLKMMGVAASFVAALVLALYLQAPAAHAAYSEPFMLWALPGAVVYWTCRVWLKVDRGDMHDDPLIFAFTDRTSLAVAALAAAAFAGAVLAPSDMLPW
jgi:4-hydroxybenzoate polyprenyltransferase